VKKIMSTNIKKCETLIGPRSRRKEDEFDETKISLLPAVDPVQKHDNVATLLKSKSMLRR